MSNCALIIGCTGQDGSYLAKSLINKKYKVIGVSRSLNPILDNHRKLDLVGQVKFIQSEISSPESFQQIIDTYKPDEIYHLSAQSSVGLSFGSPVETLTSIVDTTRSILEACRLSSYGGRIFIAGSSEIFGETSSPANMNSKIQAQSPYAYAKVQSLGLGEMYKNIYGLKVVTGILFNHESPLRKENFVTQKIISGAINCSLNKDRKLYLGNINIFRDWGWAEEYVEAIQLITRADKIENHVICTGKKNSLNYFIKKVFNTLNLNHTDFVISKSSLKRSFEIKESVGDPNPLKIKHGWKAKYDIDSIITMLIENRLKEKTQFV